MKAFSCAIAACMAAMAATSCAPVIGALAYQSHSYKWEQPPKAAPTPIPSSAPAPAPAPAKKPVTVFFTRLA